MRPHRAEKVESVLTETLTSILIRDFDFEGALVTVLGITLSGDGLKARVRLGIIPYEKGPDAFLKLLREERFLRHKILKSTRLRSVPKLIFEIAEENKEN